MNGIYTVRHRHKSLLENGIVLPTIKGNLHPENLPFELTSGAGQWAGGGELICLEWHKEQGVSILTG